MDSEPPPLPASKPIRRFQVVRTTVGIVIGVGLSALLLQLHLALQCHSYFLYGMGEAPWWRMIVDAPFGLGLFFHLLTVGVVPIAVFLHFDGRRKWNVAGIFLTLAVSVASAFLIFRHKFEQGTGKLACKVAGILYDVSLREDPERVVAWARDILAKAPPDAHFDEVADSDVPEYVKQLWGGPKNAHRPRVTFLKVAHDSHGVDTVRINWGGGFLGWGFQITPGNQSLNQNQDRDLLPNDVHWTREIRIFASD